MSPKTHKRDTDSLKDACLTLHTHKHKLLGNLWMYVLTMKNELIKTSKRSKALVKKQVSKKVKRPLLIMARNVTPIESFYKDEGIIICNTKGTPQQYSATKRINNTQRTSHAL